MDAFHVIHKVPAGDSPYVRAKRLQVVEKDHEAAIVWFWKAINSGDRVDSALKDMAVVMKQQDRAEEAIEAIRSFRHRCSKQAQESLDNLLIDLYKKCGRIDDQISLLKGKLRAICRGEAFNGKATKAARSHGKKFRVSVGQETARILGNLGWAYMQQSNYDAAEVVYRKAQLVEPDANKACNLAVCLVKKGRFEDARRVLEEVVHRRFNGLGGSGSEEEEGNKSVSRAKEMMREMVELERSNSSSSSSSMDYYMLSLEEEEEKEAIERVMMNEWRSPLIRSRRLPIFEEISSLRDQMHGSLSPSLAC